MPTTLVNGIQIYWQVDGQDGDPVVLVHGSWGDHQNWAPVVPALSRSFRVLTYDRRGHSGSERPPGQGSVREDSADLAALLEDTAHAPAHVIGSSFGASIVLRLAIERPEFFRTMILHEPPLFALVAGNPGTEAALAAVQDRISAVVNLLTAGEWERGARQFVESIAFGPGSWPELPHQVRDTFVFNAPTWLDEVRDPEAMGIDLTGLRGVSVPTLLTIGELSPPFFAQVVGHIAKSLPHAVTRMYDGAGHVPHLSHPDEYVRVVSAFAQELSAN
jgi:pimeloyl-ACP methyl ester carboxylesterase